MIREKEILGRKLMALKPMTLSPVKEKLYKKRNFAPFGKKIIKLYMKNAYVILIIYLIHIEVQPIWNGT